MSPRIAARNHEGGSRWRECGKAGGQSWRASPTAINRRSDALHSDSLQLKPHDYTPLRQLYPHLAGASWLTWELLTRSGHHHPEETSCFMIGIGCVCVSRSLHVTNIHGDGVEYPYDGF